MSLTYTTPPHLRPRELWSLRLRDGQEAYAVLGPTTYCVTAVWYLDDVFQAAAEFE